MLAAAVGRFFAFEHFIKDFLCYLLLLEDPLPLNIYEGFTVFSATVGLSFAVNILLKIYCVICHCVICWN